VQAVWGGGAVCLGWLVMLTCKRAAISRDLSNSALFAIVDSWELLSMKSVAVKKKRITLRGKNSGSCFWALG